MSAIDAIINACNLPSAIGSKIITFIFPVAPSIADVNIFFLDEPLIYFIHYAVSTENDKVGVNQPMPLSPWFP